MHRTYDAKVLHEQFQKHSRLKDFSSIPDAWLANRDNIALQAGKDFGLFTLERPGVYSGHYIFSTKGKPAKTVAIEMLKWMFDRDAKLIVGYTPVENREASLMTRWLGFVDHGVVVVEPHGPHYLFTLTPEQLNG